MPECICLLLSERGPHRSVLTTYPPSPKHPVTLNITSPNLKFVEYAEVTEYLCPDFIGTWKISRVDRFIFLKLPNGTPHDLTTKRRPT